MPGCGPNRAGEKPSVRRQCAGRILLSCRSLRWGDYPALFGHVGARLHWRVSEHVVFRPEARVVTFGVVPIGACFVAGLSLTADR